MKKSDVFQNCVFNCVARGKKTDLKVTLLLNILHIVLR